jgi:hypothetical protein
MTVGTKSDCAQVHSRSTGFVDTIPTLTVINNIISNHNLNFWFTSSESSTPGRHGFEFMVSQISSLPYPFIQPPAVINQWVGSRNRREDSKKIVVLWSFSL